MTALKRAPTQQRDLDNKTEENRIPENVPKWESSAAGKQEDPHIVEVAFVGTNARKRESLVKPPRNVSCAELRSREFLTPCEVEKLISAAEKVGRHGHTNATILPIAYRHALRAGELVSLRWD